MSATLLHTVNNTTTDVEHTSMSSSMVAYAPIEQLAEPYEGIPVFVQTHEIDGRYFADMLMEPDLPHHGEGSTPDEAMASLFEALKASWKSLNSAKKLSTHMEKRKLRLDDLFHQVVTVNW